jgi:hypothetical protein
MELSNKGEASEWLLWNEGRTRRVRPNVPGNHPPRGGDLLQGSQDLTEGLSGLRRLERRAESDKFTSEYR